MLYDYREGPGRTPGPVLPQSDNKRPWRSRTILGNLAVAVVLLIPGAQDLIREYPELITIGLALLNIALRLLTKGGITL